MKKFVLLSDGKNFSHKAFQFISNLYEKEPFLLTGAFFHSINDGLVISNTFAPGGPYVVYTKTEQDAYNKGIQEFTALCIANNIEHRVHRESDEWNLDDMIKETRFADMVIVSGELFFADIEPEQPNRYLREVLKYAECPVLVIPEEVQCIKRIAIAYNGKKESMFALKMFCDVFPGLTHLPTDIFYWVKKTDDDIPDFDYLQEFASRHFSNLNFRELFFDPSEYLATWTNKQKDTLFISGSYNRSKISNWFKKSFADDILKKHAAPVFIAHAV